MPDLDRPVVLKSSQPPRKPPRAKQRDEIADDPRLVSAMEEENPFMIEDEEFLPRVPDSRDWHYFWMRANRGDKADGQNIIRKMRSKFQYEIVKPSDLPEFMPNKATRPDIGADVIQFNDVVLVRCPQIRYQQYLEANAARARHQKGAGTQRAREKLGQHFDDRPGGYVDKERRVMESIAGGSDDRDEFRP